MNCENDNSKTDALSHLLDRPAPSGYLEDWHARIREKRDEEEKNMLPLLVFRINQEWLALSVRAVAEITADAPVHRVPHRTNKVLRGIVNVRGELQLAISLRSLIEVEQSNDAPVSNGNAYPRQIVLQREGERFVSRVDEVVGIVPFEQDSMEPNPVNVSKSLATYTRGLYPWQKTKVAHLDDELVFHSILNKYL